MTKAARAELAYSKFCAVMDAKGWKYEKSGDRNIALQLTGEDLPMSVFFDFEEDEERIAICSTLPFDIADTERQTDLLLATTCINQQVAVGTFCVDLNKNVCAFHSCEMLTEVTDIADEFAERVITGVFTVLEEYNAQLYAINKGDSAKLQALMAQVRK